jgi:hypothetical protein
VPSPAQSFDVVMKGYFDEGISWEWEIREVSW